MGLIIVFHIFMLVPGMEQPAVYEQQVATIEECIGMVARYQLKVQEAMKTGVYQAGCQITVPPVETH